MHSLLGKKYLQVNLFLLQMLVQEYFEVSGSRLLFHIILILPSCKE